MFSFPIYYLNNKEIDSTAIKEQTESACIYNGKKYTIRTCDDKNSICKRIAYCTLASLATLFSLGFALRSLSIRNLWKKVFCCVKIKTLSEQIIANDKTRSIPDSPLKYAAARFHQWILDQAGIVRKAGLGLSDSKEAIAKYENACKQFKIEMQRQVEKFKNEFSKNLQEKTDTLALMLGAYPSLFFCLDEKLQENPKYFPHNAGLGDVCIYFRDYEEASA